MLGNLDVLCLQEVKIVGFLLNSSCSVIWPDSALFSSHHEANQDGVVILLPPYLISSIVSQRSDLM
jgi:hypothetical protein